MSPPPTQVSGTPQDSGRDMPVIGNRTKNRRIRLLRADSLRGPNQGAPNAESSNIYPFPFLGLWSPARHGHYPVSPVGSARRVGAFRVAGTGTLGGNHKRTGPYA